MAQVEKEHKEIPKGMVEKPLPYSLHDLTGMFTAAGAEPEKLQTTMLLTASHRLDQPWIGWQINRNTAPGMTGFEPFFIGTGSSEREIGEHLDTLGRSVLTGLSESEKKRVLRTLGDGTPSLDALIYSYVAFGGILMRLRTQLVRNRPANMYRSVTEQLSQSSVPIRYDTERQVRIHRLPTHALRPPIPIPPATYDTTGYEVMQRIGKMGDPLLRTAIREVPDGEAARLYNRLAFKSWRGNPCTR